MLLRFMIALNTLGMKHTLLETSQAEKREEMESQHLLYTEYSVNHTIKSEFASECMGGNKTQYTNSHVWNLKISHGREYISLLFIYCYALELHAEIF
jgi:hypothetical protein